MPLNNAKPFFGKILSALFNFNVLTCIVYGTTYVTVLKTCCWANWLYLT